jgi:predicted dehydrogenase
MPPGVQIIGCFDLSQDARENFARDFRCETYSSLCEVLQDSRVDFLVIATQHDVLNSIALAALESDKHVFLEKPGAIRSADLRSASVIARSRGLKFHIGFNHQFHPAILKMFELIENDAVGEVMFMRARYGHGGRVGYENEWRAKKEISGGGELIDQGSHLIDISLRLFHNLKVEYAATPTYFWKMDVEDNAFLILKDDEGRIAFLHASCTEWKNLFSIEVYGKSGKVEISGLGRSYGLETLTYYQMLPEMGPPLTQIWQFPEFDNSWSLELEQFTSDINDNTDFSNNVATSVKVLELIETIYERSGR